MRVLIATLLLLVPSSALGTQVVSLDLEAMSDRAAVAVLGAVTHVEAQRLQQARGRIYTAVTVSVRELLKHDTDRAAKTVTFFVPGGKLGKLGQWVPGAPKFARGMEVLVLLNRHPTSNRLTLIGLSQGRYVVERPSGAPASVVSDRSGLGLVIRNAKGRLEPAPQGRQLDRRPLDAALNLIRKRAAQPAE